MDKIKKAVIPAAGYGTRFLPITKLIPKELLPVGSKPALQYVVEEAVSAGIEEIILVCHPSKLSLADYFEPDERLIHFLEKKGKGEELQRLKKIESIARFKVVYQEEPLGLGHAIGCARDEVGGEPFLVLLPDRIVDHAVSASQQLIDVCQREEGWGVLLERVPRDRLSAYGIVGGKEAGKEGVYRLERAIEKPQPEEAPSDLAIMGRYLFPPEIFPCIEASRAGALGEIQLTDAIDALARKKNGFGVLCRGKIFDVGVPEGLIEASAYFTSEKEPLGQGPVRR